MVGLGMQPELHYPRRSHFAPGNKQTFGSQRKQSYLYDIIEKAVCQDSTCDSALIYPRPLCVKIDITEFIHYRLFMLNVHI